MENIFQRITTFLLILVAASIPASVAVSQDTTNPDVTGEQITLNFQDVDIRALITTVSEVTGRNFIVDPRVKGKVTLVSGGPLDAKEIYRVFLSVLEVHNFSAVPTGAVIKILPSNVVKQRPTPTLFGQNENQDDRQITQVLRLQHASVQELLPILRPLLPPTSHFAAHAATNTLVFTDTAANVARVMEIVNRIDVPDRRSSVHVVYLEHARASSLAGVLSQLTTSLQTSGEPAAQGNAISVQADDSVNALVINAPDNEFRLLQAVIDQLDIDRPLEGDVHVVYLRYATADDLVDILNEVTAVSQPAEGQAPAEQISVQADEATNALVISAPEDEFRTIQAVIDKLDVRREQVFVETIIAEVSGDKAADLGIQWRANDSSSQNTGQISGSSLFPATDDLTSGLTLGYLSKQVISIAGVIVPELEVVLRALRADRNTNILSTPNLLTLDNEEAEIVVGQEVPFVTGQFVSDVSTTDTGDTTGTGVVNPFQTIERKDVGLTLTITPQINAGDSIRLEIEQEISSVSPTTVAGASDLITDRRSISATVQVDDGQIVVLGGLIRDDVIENVEWVPVLGKIPVLGALFRRKSKSAVKTNLMVFLRPKIVRTRDDLAGYTADKYRSIREAGKDNQPTTKTMIDGVNVPILPDLDFKDKSE